MVEMLKQTQYSLELANERLEAAFQDNARTFNEREQVWTQELSKIKQHMQRLKQI
jgi:hypothetical protein